MTLAQLVHEWHEKQCRKHNLAEDAEEYAEEKFNELTPAQQLSEISDALDTYFKNHINLNH